MQEAGLPTYDVGIEFGTVGTVLYGPEGAAREGGPGYPKDCQITTYRSEEYYRRGSRHPQVQYGETLMQDLKRRDFSINSIAMDAAGEFIDPYDGLGDLERGVLRVVGDPLETLAEDPLRILRVGRFIAKLGFEADEDLHQACVQRADHILEISRERWLQEMTKLVRGEFAPKGLAFLYEVRILDMILPEVSALVGLHETSSTHHKDVWAHTLQVIDQAERAPAQRWAALLHDIGKPWTRLVDADQVTFWRHERHGAMLFEGIASRFKFDNDLTRKVHAIITHHGRISQYDSEWSDAAVRRLVRDLDPYVEALLRFARADLTTKHDEKRQAALARVDELAERIAELERARQLRPELPDGFGYALMQSFELESGPIIGELIEHLTEQMIAGELASGRPAQDYIEHLRQSAPPELLEALHPEDHDEDDDPPHEA